MSGSTTTPEASAAAAGGPAAPAARKWLVTVAVMLGATLEVLDTSIVNVSLPHMQGSFSASVDEVTWVLTSYIIANGIMMPLTGWISARYGRKRYFLASVVVFVIASGLCGAARTLGEMVVFRFVQGVAGASMIPSSQAILMETFPPAEQGFAMSVWGLGLLTSPMLGPTLGGWITDNWTWRWNFYINLPIGTLAAVLVWAFVHDPDYLRAKPGATRRIDWLGVALLVLGLGCLQIVLDRGQRADWFAAPWVCAFTAISAVSLVALVVHELRFPAPILDLSIVGIGQFRLAVTFATAMYLVVYGMNLLNPLFFQNLLGYPAWNAGLAILPRGLGTLAGMLLAGQVSRLALDPRPFVAGGFAILGYALWSMGHWNLDIGASNAVVPMVLSGFGSGLIFPILSAATLAWVARERMGHAASLYNTVRNTGAAIGISLVSNLLNSRTQVHQSYLTEHFTTFEAWAARDPLAPGVAATLGESAAAGRLEGLGVLYESVRHQADLLAYNDIYDLLAALSVVLIPLCVFLRRKAR